MDLYGVGPIGQADTEAIERTTATAVRANEKNNLRIGCASLNGTGMARVWVELTSLSTHGARGFGSASVR